MTFYLQPPSGNVSYQKLEEFGLNRFRLLARLLACKNAEERREAILDADIVNWSDCLIAGSVKDKISHYVLRLAATHSVDFARFLCDSETIFFRMRLNTFTSHEWLAFFKTLKRQLSQYHCDTLAEIHVFYASLSNEPTSWSCLAEGIKNSRDESRCIRLPFQLVLRLVADRRVILNGGYALVPLFVIPEVLEELFSRLMTKMMHQICHKGKMLPLSDSRMSRLSAVIQSAYQREVSLTPVIPLGSKALTLDTLASSQVCFPLCMTHLMSTLDQHHRLCHQDRIQLTLFLKELGLPVHQALLFWKREYSKPSIARLNGTKCGHDWQGNERRYIYNIRHLYGLEGKRVSYAAHSCRSIQARQISCLDCGGCPFTSLKLPDLSTVLTKQGIPQLDIEDIVNHVREGRVQTACMMETFSQMKQKISALDGLVTFPVALEYDKKSISSGRAFKKSEDLLKIDWQHSNGPSDNSFNESCVHTQSNKSWRIYKEPHKIQQFAGLDSSAILDEGKYEEEALTETKYDGSSECENSLMCNISREECATSKTRFVLGKVSDNCTGKRKLVESHSQDKSKKTRCGLSPQSSATEVSSPTLFEYSNESEFEAEDQNSICNVESSSNANVKMCICKNCHSLSQCVAAVNRGENCLDEKNNTVNYKMCTRCGQHSSQSEQCHRIDFQSKSRTNVLISTNNESGNDVIGCQERILYNCVDRRKDVLHESENENNSSCIRCDSDMRCTKNDEGNGRQRGPSLKYQSCGGRPSSVYWDIKSIIDR